VHVPVALQHSAPVFSSNRWLHWLHVASFPGLLPDFISCLWRKILRLGYMTVGKVQLLASFLALFKACKLREKCACKLTAYPLSRCIQSVVHCNTV